MSEMISEAQKVARTHEVREVKGVGEEDRSTLTGEREPDFSALSVGTAQRSR